MEGVVNQCVEAAITCMLFCLNRCCKLSDVTPSQLVQPRPATPAIIQQDLLVPTFSSNIIATELIMTDGLMSSHTV